MALAFVLLNVEPGTEEEVRDTVSKIEEVEDAHLVYGTYDLVLKLRAGTMDDVKKAVTGKIRKLKEVRSTLTMLVAGPLTA
ncbi:MAG: Lrp/AsnC family transcriptional regulator [Candidatus Geothermarchaeales archaeon]